MGVRERAREIGLFNVERRKKLYFCCIFSRYFSTLRLGKLNNLEINQYPQDQLILLKTKRNLLIRINLTQQIILKMRATSDNIASETKNCSFSCQSIEKFLVLMAIQQTAYADFTYKANGPFALVLRAKKNGIAEVALKVLECTDHTDCQIKAMESEYAISK